MMDNPFGVQNPELVDAAYIAKNFVDVFTEFPRLREPGNTFIHGARGTGKSMLLRSLEPGVSLLRGGEGARLMDLPFLAVHVPLKMAEFAAPELARYRGFVSTSLGEHLLVMQIMFRVAGLLCSLAGSTDRASADAFAARFSEIYRECGGKAAAAADVHVNDGPVEVFSRIARVCEKDIIGVRQYYTRAPFQTAGNDYSGALTGFLDFLVPLALAISQMRGIPKVPLFVMLDDADNLPFDMQRVLNSWVSTRSTYAVCLKITTQLGYATWRTIDNRIIESPHDFIEVNLNAVYTSENASYNNRVRQIIAKRLNNAGLGGDVEAFFPKDEDQARRLAKIAGEIEAEHAERAMNPDGQRRGSARVRDERLRYAVPRLMRDLAGSSRSAHTYSYAGFKSLVDLSSGVVRWFLEPASRMYDRMVSEDSGPVTSIPVAVQDRVIREWSTEFLDLLSQRSSQSIDTVSDGDSLPVTLSSLHARGHETELYEQLRNLIEGLGLLFRQRLLDPNTSEQRVFSVVLRDRPSKDLDDVLAMGIRLGYFQRSDNAAKEALGGRRPRYILARRLGPHYNLDVSGHAAHLSVMSSDLLIALGDPRAFVRARLKAAVQDEPQFTLDFDRTDNGSTASD